MLLTLVLAGCSPDEPAGVAPIVTVPAVVGPGSATAEASGHDASHAPSPSPSPTPDQTESPAAEPDGPTPPRRHGPLPKASALPAAGSVSYAELVAAIEADRRTFAAFDARDEAANYVYEAVTDRLIPAWKGTPWAFYGTAEVPGDEPVACGYWVASILRDVGFRVDRSDVGQQASERILRTFAPSASLHHFGRKPTAEIVEWIAHKGRGLWGVGLANHAGLVWNDGTEVRFCHSNYNNAMGPVCENASYSGPFRTNYTVVASMLAPETIGAWLAGAPLATGAFP